MAKRHLTQYDSEGRKVSIYLEANEVDVNGRPLDEVIGEGVYDPQYVHTDNNYTTAEKNKLAGLRNYDDTDVQTAIRNINDAIDRLTGTSDTTEIIDTMNEVIDFLSGLDNTDSLANELVSIRQQLANKLNAGDAYNKQEVDDLLDVKQEIINDLVTIRNGARLGATAVQTETDPTVPSWAKQPRKPTYTAAEVGALPANTTIPQGTVTAVKVNDGQPVYPNASGVVSLTISTSGEQVQPDWNETNMESPAYIQNKPDVANAISVNQHSYVMNNNHAFVIPDYYTKTEVDDKVANAGKVKSVSVNGTNHTPDSNGVVDLGTIQGQKGDKGDTGNCQITGDGSNIVSLIVNDLTTGGAGNILSAEMGKRVAGREATDRQRIDAIVAILKKSVFTDDQTEAFAELDALANGIDSIAFNASSHKFTNLGDTFTLSIVTDPAGKTAQVTWATSNASVATVNNGVVTAVADGTATITATTTDGKVAVCKIEVATIHITGLTLNKSTLTLNGNDANETLIATTTPSGYESGVQWSSSDPTKATVDNSGKVTAVANGSATITASISGLTATCQVTVTGVMQTFHVSVGTLSNVTVEDGQGNAITNGQAVLEGSSLTVKLVPAANYEITTASVTMGGVAQTLTDNQDGSKSVALTVDGDIAVSASAVWTPTDLITQATAVTGYGVPKASADYKAAVNYDSFIVPLEFGKWYKITGYDWYSEGGESETFSFALVKSDGAGGFTNLTEADLSSSHPLFTKNNTLSISSGKYYLHTGANLTNTTLRFSTPPSSEVSGVDRIYLAINKRYGSVDISTHIHVYENMFGASHNSADISDIIRNWGLLHPNYNIGIGASYDAIVIKAEKGATYEFSGSGTVAGIGVAIVKSAGGLLNDMGPSDFASGAAWLSSDHFFGHTACIFKAPPANASGTFTMPQDSDFASPIDDLYIVFNTRFGKNDFASTLTIEKSE